MTLPRFSSSDSAFETKWTVLLHPLVLHLQALEAHLLHGVPLDDFISAHTPLHQQHTLFLAGHSLLFAGRLLSDEQEEQTLHLIQDLACTVQRHAPTCGALVEVINDFIGHLYLDRVSGSPLHLHEVQQAATLLLDRAAALHLNLFPSNVVFTQLYRRPLTLENPLAPPLESLHPDPTFVPERQARERELRHLLTSATRLEEQYAALLLLHLNARDRYTNQAVNDPLDMAAACLMIARDRHTEDRTSAAHTQALRVHLQAIHQELDRVRVPSLRPGAFVERRGRAQILHQTLDLLRQAHYKKLADDATLNTTHAHFLWVALERLEDRWSPDLSPLEREHLELQLMLRACCALTDIFRAPGMGLPPLVEVATQLSGLDPLWGWKELQPDLKTQRHEQVGLALRQIMCLLDISVSYQAQQDAGTELAWLLREGVGHLLACCRRAGVRLPRQHAVEQMLSSGQPIRASLLPFEAFMTFRLRIGNLIEHLDTLSVTPDTAPLPTPDLTPLPAPEATPLLAPEASTTELETAPLVVPSISIDPPHVQDVRAILQGRRLVLIGGVPDAAHHQAIMTSLGLAELDWIAADEYAHGTHAQARLTDQTALVVIAIRWMGHAHSALREVARAKGIPYVMHPGGLNPNSLAWQILQQTSRQLGTLAS